MVRSYKQCYIDAASWPPPTSAPSSQVAAALSPRASGQISYGWLHGAPPPAPFRRPSLVDPLGLRRASPYQDDTAPRKPVERKAQAGLETARTRTAFDLERRALKANEKRRIMIFPVRSP